MAWRLPLSIVLGLQVIIVAAAFATVISVLSIQQSNEFRDSLYKQLSLRQSFVMDSVTSPLIRRMATFDFAVDSYVAGTNGDKIFPAPSDDLSTSGLDVGLAFLNHFYVYTKDDPIFQMTTVANQSMRVFPAYINTTRPWTWNVWVVDRVKFAGIVKGDEKAEVCFASYPIPSLAAKCPARMAIPYRSNVMLGYPPEYSRSRRMLSAANLIDDPTLSAGKTHVMTYSRNFPWFTPTGEMHFLLFAASIAITHVKPLILSQSSLPSSRSALFTRYPRIEDGSTDYHLIAAKKDFTDFNETILNLTQDSGPATWRAGRTPDPVMNAVFFQCKDMFVNDTDSAAFEIKVGGHKYIASASRAFQPNYDMNWLMFEYTPYDDWFGVSDRARMVGIIIGVVGGVVVLISCVLIWVAIQFPLRSLKDSMSLAAEMRNDEVVHSNPILSEIGDLNDAFKQMNAKLLAARPFLPQSLLRANGSSDDDDLDDEEGSEFGLAGDDQTHTTATNIAAAVCSATERSSRMEDSNTSMSVMYRRGQHNPSNSAEVASMASSHRNGTKGKLRVLGGMNGVSQRELTFRRVAILSINVLGFGDIMPSHSDARSTAYVARTHTLLAKLIEQTTAEERGIVDYFHGDRFVCGFNTARVCGNAARNGAEAAAKIWDRFLASGSSAANNQSNTARAHNGVFDTDTARRSQHSAANNPSAGAASDLMAAFPNGLAMGLGVGRAAVGNHGTETMQRLATIGGAYSEAMRLQEVMTRRVLMGRAKGSNSTTANNSAVRGPNPLVAGRCLVMGRVIQELETSKVYCQIVGAVDARELLTSSGKRSKAAVTRFAATTNVSCMRLGNQQADDAFAALVNGGGDTSPKPGGETAVHIVPSSTTPSNPAIDPNAHTHPADTAALSRTSVLVAAIVSSASVRRALAELKAYQHSAEQQQHLSTSGSTTQIVIAHTSEDDSATDSGSMSRKRTTRHTPALLPTMGVGVAVPSSLPSPSAGVSPALLSARRANNHHHHHHHHAIDDQLEADEWLYELQNEQSRNPFIANNTLLYRVWNEPTAALIASLAALPKMPPVITAGLPSTSVFGAAPVKGVGGGVAAAVHETPISVSPAEAPALVAPTSSTLRDGDGSSSNGGRKVGGASHTVAVPLWEQLGRWGDFVSSAIHSSVVMGQFNSGVTPSSALTLHEGLRDCFTFVEHDE